MKHSVAAVLATLTAMPFMASARSVARDDKGQDDGKEVCYPDTTYTFAEDPCVAVTVVEATCEANETHTDFNCMCNGVPLSDEDGCQKCLVVHGFREEDDLEHWQSVLSSASNDLCNETPAASYESYVYSAECTEDAAPTITTVNVEYTEMYTEMETETYTNMYVDMSGMGPYNTPTVSPCVGTVTTPETTATVVRTSETTKTLESAPLTSSTPSTSSATATEKHTDDATSTWNLFGGIGGPDEPTSTHSTGGAVATQKAGLAMAVAGAALVLAV